MKVMKFKKSHLDCLKGESERETLWLSIQYDGLKINWGLIFFGIPWIIQILKIYEISLRFKIINKA